MAEERSSPTVLGPVFQGFGNLVGFVVTAPVRVPVVRSVVKEVVKLGLRVSDKTQVFAAGQRRTWQELVAEAEAEAVHEHDSGPVEKEGATASGNAAPGSEDDLRSLEDVGPEEAQLLRRAGIRSARTLARRRADTLHKKMLEVNEEEAIVHDTPSVARVQRWIDSANQEG